ncbi:aspartate 1-decarboxylase [Paenibacillus sp. Marseille-Q9583]
MFRTLLKSKIHKAIVTEANLNYVGSITIDKNILNALDMLPNEKVQIVNNNNGARFETYIIEGAPGSGIICLNGAAARLVQIDDTIIIMSYVILSDEEARKHIPRVGIMGKNNKIVEILNEELQSTIL